ncbi:hypothetical protein LTR66_017906 [Elasticomyces elasticus]|nr:hypothetical protein LTR66_017906 [Elasticomyces elasticus]
MTHPRQRGDELEREQTMICTWGAEGAYAAVLTADYLAASMSSSKNGSRGNKGSSITEQTMSTSPESDASIDTGVMSRKLMKLALNIMHSPAYLPANPQMQPVIDTVGAGDTFIAGCLYGYISRDDVSDKDKWLLGQKLSFANQLAGRKILRQGFRGLGKLVEDDGLLN